MILVLGQHSYDTSMIPLELTKIIEKSRFKYFTFLFIIMGVVSIVQAYYVTWWTNIKIVVPLLKL